MSMTAAKFAEILKNDNIDFGSNLWKNILKADMAVAAMHQFWLENSSETGVTFTYGNGDTFKKRAWNGGEEVQFIQMFEDLSVFLLTQSDELALTTLRNAIRRLHISSATDLVKTKHWSALSSRLYPILVGQK